MIPHHCAFFRYCACFGIKNTNVSTRFDQSHQLFHKILSLNIILKSIKGHNSVENLGKKRLLVTTWIISDTYINA